MAKCGIYKITNKINGHAYIGQSTDIDRRFKEHLDMRYESSLYSAVIKYKDVGEGGWNNFTFEILELCSKEQLCEREIYWVAYYDTYNNGYNRSKGGEGSPASGHRCRVAQYDLEGNFIKEFASISDAEEELNARRKSNISRSCHNKNYESNGFQWRFIDETNKNTYKENIGKSYLAQSKIDNALATRAKRLGIPIEEVSLIRVAMCDKQTHEVIKIFNSVQDAQHEVGLKSHSGIYKVIHGERKSAGGYWWKEI